MQITKMDVQIPNVLSNLALKHCQVVPTIVANAQHNLAVQFEYGQTNFGQKT